MKVYTQMLEDDLSFEEVRLKLLDLGADPTPSYSRVSSTIPFSFG